MMKIAILVLVLLAFALIHFQKTSTDVWASRLILAAIVLLALFVLIQFLSRI